MSITDEINQLSALMVGIEKRTKAIILKYKTGISCAPPCAQEEYWKLINTWSEKKSEKLRLEEELMKKRTARELNLLRQLMIHIKSDLDGDFKNPDAAFYGKIYQRYKKIKGL